MPSAEEMAKIEKEEPLDHKELEARVKFIQGKVLTVIEAVIPEKGQLKATKDLVNHIFSEQLTRLYNLTHPNQEMLTEADMFQFGHGSIERFIEDNSPRN